MKHLEFCVKPYLAFQGSLPDLQNKTKTPKLQISLMLGITVFLLETRTYFFFNKYLLSRALNSNSIFGKRKLSGLIPTLKKLSASIETIKSQIKWDCPNVSEIERAY